MTDDPERQELRPLLRDEPPPSDAIAVVRGGPSSVVRLDLLPSLRRPHFTVRLESDSDEDVQRLLDGL